MVGVVVKGRVVGLVEWVKWVVGSVRSGGLAVVRKSKVVIEEVELVLQNDNRWRTKGSKYVSELTVIVSCLRSERIAVTSSICSASCECLLPDTPPLNCSPFRQSPDGQSWRCSSLPEAFKLPYDAEIS